VQGSLGSLENSAVLGIHHYDALTLSQKRFCKGFTIELRDIFSTHRRSLIDNIMHPAALPVVGSTAAAKSHHRQMLRKRAVADGAFQELLTEAFSIPALVSEVGIPFDVRDIYGRDFRPDVHIDAFDLSLRALDHGFWSYTLWNYSIENDNLWGDFWNRENLSIYSEGADSGFQWSRHPSLEVMRPIYRNIRALPALVRPHVVLLAGTPMHQQFDIFSRSYCLVWTVNDQQLLDSGSVNTTVFLPLLHFGAGFRIEASDGILYRWEPGNQTLVITSQKAGSQKVVVTAFEGKTRVCDSSLKSLRQALLGRCAWV
jgi:hypothetical protein